MPLFKENSSLPDHIETANSSSPLSQKKTSEGKQRKNQERLASISDVFSFGSTRIVIALRLIGVIFSIASGAIYPAMAFYFAKIFQDLSSPTTGDQYMGNLTEMVFVFLVLGFLGFVMIFIQITCLEFSAYKSTIDLKVKWFNALLRQDMAYFDIKDVSSQATIVSAYAAKYKKGTGKKLGDGIQFTATALGGIVYAFYASWKTSLIILATVPFMALSSKFMMNIIENQTAREKKNYHETGGIVHATLSSIRTVFSLNASMSFIKKFEEATEKAMRESQSRMFLIGVGNGSMMASFMASYAVLTLFGAFLLYGQVAKSGCDPSGGVPQNMECHVTGMDVFGSLMGISFGAIGLTQVTVSIEAFIGSRGACYPALLAMRRQVGNVDEDGNYEEKNGGDIESGDADAALDRKDIPLPKYVIDSSSSEGLEPEDTKAEIEFHDVSFSYPTRSKANVFDGLSLKVTAGQTVAIVGPSGSGKSTIVQLLERFYDPTSGSITFGGYDLRDLNVQWLRNQIGLVSQEPTLFARSIRENIAYGCPQASMKQIIEVAKVANAHSFIQTFPDGYDTQVGDKGAQLSGGQKQRIAIARILLKNPKLMLLDEATSALDSESEYAVQKAIDDLLGIKNCTTIVIAHRISTIRNADMIAVVKDGTIIEMGTHSDLLSLANSEYRRLAVAKQTAEDVASISQSASVDSELCVMDEIIEDTIDENGGMDELVFKDVCFSYPTRPGNQIFKMLNLSVKQGETLALVGPSGGGKSTVVQLIERFYDPTSGSISLGNIDLRNLNIQYLRDQLGLVSQEPMLFNTTIRENIQLGFPSASQDDIENAAIQANAHDFIRTFPKGYDTEVGESSTQISGGQKQRIAIARAILKEPKILLLDEATSALDSQSEQIVQDTINKVMTSKLQTILVIAHRLSTIRNADRIAVIDKGSVQEIGTHDYLMSLPNGQYRRLYEIQSTGDVPDDGYNQQKCQLSTWKDESSDGILSPNNNSISNNVEPTNNAISKDDQKKYVAKARSYAVQDISLLVVGVIGAIMAGLIFPGWGVVFAYMIELLYRPVFYCDEDFLSSTTPAYPTCQDYWTAEAGYLRIFSFKVTAGWIVLILSSMLGNILLVHGFGSAVERMNKRIRDEVFRALMRQDVAYFDAHTVGNLSTRIEDDAAMIHSFSGEPLRTFTMSAASVLVGLVLSFIFMWPFALLSLTVLPLMSLGSYIEMKTQMGQDDKEIASVETTLSTSDNNMTQSSSEEGQQNDVNRNITTNPGSIVVETLLNIRTVASLSIEKIRASEYQNALTRENPAPLKTDLLKGAANGFAFVVQQWGMGLMFWWGGYIMDTYPDIFNFKDYLISMFALLFSISGMSAALMDMTDKDKAKKAAVRIFALIERESNINSLSDEGLKGAE